MGTMRKQKQIQHALNAMGWSLRVFAEVIYGALYEDECNASFEVDKDQIKKLSEKIKKQLKRKTTSEEILDSYLCVLSEHPDYQALKLGTISTEYVEHACLTDELSNELRALSCELDDGEEVC